MNEQSILRFAVRHGEASLLPYVDRYGTLAEFYAAELPRLDAVLTALKCPGVVRNRQLYGLAFWLHRRCRATAALLALYPGKLELKCLVKKAAGCIERALLGRCSSAFGPGMKAAVVTAIRTMLELETQFLGKTVIHDYITEIHKLGNPFLNPERSTHAQQVSHYYAPGAHPELPARP